MNHKKHQRSLLSDHARAQAVPITAEQSSQNSRDQPKRSELIKKQAPKVGTLFFRALPQPSRFSHSEDFRQQCPHDPACVSSCCESRSWAFWLLLAI